MLGTGMMPHQNDRGNKTGQGNIGKQRIPMNGPNPAAESGLSTVLPESELRTGAETSLELAGQNPEAAAQQAEQIVKKEIESFNKQELTKLGIITKEAARKIGLGPNEVALIYKEFELTIIPFAEEADRLSMETSAQIQQVLSNNSGSNPGSTQDSNEPPLSFLGPNTPSKQNPQGPVSAA